MISYAQNLMQLSMNRSENKLNKIINILDNWKNKRKIKDRCQKEKISIDELKNELKNKSIQETNNSKQNYNDVIFELKNQILINNEKTNNLKSENIEYYFDNTYLIYISVVIISTVLLWIIT